MMNLVAHSETSTTNRPSFTVIIHRRNVCFLRKSVYFCRLSIYNIVDELGGNVTCKEDSALMKMKMEMIMMLTSHVQCLATGRHSLGALWSPSTSVERCAYIHQELLLSVSWMARCEPAYRAAVMHGIHKLRETVRVNDGFTSNSTEK